MSFVIDENVSYGLVETLRDKGEKVIAITEDKQGKSDTAVFNIAMKDKAVMITRDYHFTNPIRFKADRIGAIIYIRQGSLTSSEEIKLVMDFLNKYPQEQFEGKLVILYKNSIKIRS